MLRLQTQLRVDDLGALEVFEFLINPTDAKYQQWWPGTHLHFHTERQRSGNIGKRVYMDEFVGGRRVRMQGVVVDAVPGAKLVWQLKRAVALPVWLTLDLVDDATGVLITHTVRAGFGGAGALLDPVFRLYFSRTFAEALDAHVREEFARFGLVFGARSAAIPAQTAMAAR